MCNTTKLDALREQLKEQQNQIKELKDEVKNADVLIKQYLSSTIQNLHQSTQKLILEVSIAELRLRIERLESAAAPHDNEIAALNIQLAHVCARRCLLD
jgi:chromosome segregation ATPase